MNWPSWKASWYQRVLSPVRGRLVDDVPLNEKSTTTTTGANRKATTSATKAHETTFARVIGRSVR